MKPGFGRTVAFAVALMGIVAFIGAPLVSYQHLSRHAVEHSDAPGTTLGGLACAASAAQGTGGPVQLAGEERDGRPDRKCHDSDCPYLHFLRSNSSPPVSTPIVLADEGIRTEGPFRCSSRIERNPVQVPLLAVAPATSPPVSFVS